MYHTAFVPFQSLFLDYHKSNKKHDMQVLQYHDTYEIYLQMAGERYLFLNGLCHTLKPMDFYLLKPFEMHYSQSLSSPYYERYVLNFSRNQLNSLLTPSERELLFSRLESGIRHLDAAQYARAVSCFQGLSSCYKQDTFLSEKLQSTYVLQLVLLLRESLSGEAPFLDQLTDSKVRPEIMDSILYINSHYQESLTLDFITEYVHISKYHFCRLFRQATGATFVEYLNKIRLSKAEQLLRETTLPLKQVALQAGFSSGVHLSRSFHAAYQMSPSEYRRRSAALQYSQHLACPENQT